MVRAMLRPEPVKQPQETAWVGLTTTLPTADQLTGAEEQHFVCKGGGREEAGRPCGRSASPSVS